MGQLLGAPSLTHQLTDIPTQGPTDAQLEQVVLDEQETAAALRSARVQKYWQLHEEKVQQTRRAVAEEAKRPWTPQEVYEYLWVRCDELRIPRHVLEAIVKQNEEAVVRLCYYFANDAGFETNGYSLKRGIYLHGYVGTGKTTLMRLFARNKKACFDISTCLDVQKLFLRDGEDLIDIMSANRGEPKDFRYFYQQEIGRCFDDLGTEERISIHYGNKRNVMQEIMQNRYAQQHAIPFCYTHVTSNLDPETKRVVDGKERPVLEAEYGSRFWDRFRDMFNIIKLKGGSLRG